MATINASMLIALPDIFRGIGVNPLQPGNTGLLLWLLMGYLVVTAVLVVSFFFPSLISAPFSHGLTIAFYFAIAACLIAAVSSLLRGGIYVHGVHPAPVARGAAAGAVAGGAAASAVSPQPRPALRSCSGHQAPRSTSRPADK